MEKYRSSADYIAQGRVKEWKNPRFIKGRWVGGMVMTRSEAKKIDEENEQAKEKVRAAALTQKELNAFLKGSQEEDDSDESANKKSDASTKE